MTALEMLFEIFDDCEPFDIANDSCPADYYIEVDRPANCYGNTGTVDKRACAACWSSDVKGKMVGWCSLKTKSNVPEEQRKREAPIVDEFGFHACPKCNSWLMGKEVCGNCGQYIDWSND